MQTIKSISLFILVACFSQWIFALNPPANTQAQQQAVKTFVNDALNYIKQNGKDKAIAEFNNPRGKFYNPRQGFYIFALDISDPNQAILMASGQDPKSVGQNQLDIKDKTGNLYIKQMAKVAVKGGGWVSYYWENPAKNNVEELKWTYVEPVNRNWFIGSGFYVSDK